MPRKELRFKACRFRQRCGEVWPRQSDLLLSVSIVADGFSEPLSQGQSTELAFGILLSR